MARRRTIQAYDDPDGSSGLGGLLLVLAACGGVVFALDQHDKRRKEQELFRQNLEALKAELAEKQQQLVDLEARLGPRNDQVRLLSEELFQLRERLSKMGQGCVAA